MPWATRGQADSLLRETENVYDSLFRLVDKYDPLEHRSHFDYDSEHHLIRSAIFPVDGKEIYNWTTYYANGLPATRRDGRGIVTAMTYDNYGNPESTQVGYNQPPVLYTYDSIGRMESLMDEATVNFAYDARDNLIGMQDSIGQTTYSYDPVNRLSWQSYPYDPDQLKVIKVGYSYDAAGNLSGVTYPGTGSRVVKYTYDALNRLETVTIDWLSKTATYHYDDAGRMYRLDQFNGTVVTQSFDDANRMTALENRTSSSAPIATYQYILDDGGNIVYAAQEVPLAPVASGVTVEYTYNQQRNHLLTAGASTFSYDNEGQLLTKDGSTYTFDYAHRLIGAGSSNQYFYDGGGNRLKAVRSGEIRKYIYDAAGRLLAEADDSNNILRYYL